ncbi:M48 family metallopeptidase [Roseovarius pelagicus]|uniref:M48 family metallopeptidase n=1 Tax=Roseovarius pelagicus TaxID=2980108 RepID=A0ABY6DGU2_9RHOB|nr:M48 family metallopeptidase [Roseovarius pelagicus]UXX84453.1 M48 family metallopeptidase [Roseovarius pelagicus]
MLPVAGRYFDGHGARRHEVQVWLAEGGNHLTILGPTLGASLEWPLQDLRALRERARKDRMTLTLHAPGAVENAAPRDAARLTITDPALMAELRKQCSALMRADVHAGSWARVVRRAVLAIGAVVLMLFLILPRMADTLASLIPVEREIAFGKAVVRQMEAALGATRLGQLDCKGGDGLQALWELAGRLASGGRLAYGLELRVLDHDMINAFAAPGGQVVIMRGLLDTASSPEVVAAVLAHEIGHVEARDATRQALRAAGSAGLLSMVLGDVTGGAAAVLLGDRILQASYTRGAEAQADVFALGLLNGADVDSSGMADFFDGLALMEGDAPALPIYFATHPASGGRAALARQNAAQQGETRPVLSAKQWRDLRDICD